MNSSYCLNMSLCSNHEKNKTNISFSNIHLNACAKGTCLSKFVNILKIAFCNVAYPWLKLKFLHRMFSPSHDLTKASTLSEPQGICHLIPRGSNSTKGIDVYSMCTFCHLGYVTTIDKGMGLHGSLLTSSESSIYTCTL